MSLTAVFIGDEVTALGWRLAGASVIATDIAAAPAALARAAESGAALVVLSASHAAAIGPDAIEQAQRRARPPVLVVADARGRQRAPNLRDAIYATLGIAR